MRLTIALLAGLLLLPGLAVAGPPQGDETTSLDLSAIGGPVIFLQCSRAEATSLTDNCGLVSIWIQSNGVPGLQTIQKPYGGVQRPRDTPVLA
ncbi:MAG TPA: hypothetical protein VFH78_12620 [Candidatus Thermoplasmatota archaeon]|nr:hypothetical protein [Candidatus Thermoplasmatota archaeon]